MDVHPIKNGMKIGIDPYPPVILLLPCHGKCPEGPCDMSDIFVLADVLPWRQNRETMVEELGVAHQPS